MAIFRIADIVEVRCKILGKLPIPGVRAMSAKPPKETEFAALGNKRR